MIKRITAARNVGDSSKLERAFLGTISAGLIV